MTRNAPHCFPEETEARRDAMPGRCTGRMGERNQIESAAFIVNGKGPAHHFIELLERQELRDGQFADGDDQLGSQEIDLVVHPGRTIPDFVRRRNTVAAGCSFARETAADSGEVDPGADLFFVHSTELLKPAEERAPRGPCEGLPQDRLFNTRCLTDEHDLAQYRTAGNGWWNHSRAAPALPQERHVPIERLLLARRARHWIEDNEARRLS